MTASIVTGFIMGILLFASCNSAVVQHTNSIVYNSETNSALQQDVSSDTDDDNIIQYHVVRGDVELWIVEDFDRGLKVSKVLYENGEYKCLVEALEESTSRRTSEMEASPSDRNLNEAVNGSMISEAAPIPSTLVEDRSFLGDAASTLCSGTPVYWTHTTSDNVTTTEPGTGKKSRSKRHVPEPCNGDCCNGRCYPRRGYPRYLSGTWRYEGSVCVEKVCRYITSAGQVKTNSWDYRNGMFGCMNEDYVPPACRSPN